MKKIFVLLLITPWFLNGFAQKADEKVFKKVSMVFDINNDFWAKVPDSINSRFFNQGVGATVYYNTPIPKSNFSFSMGAGFTTHNFHSNGVFDTITGNNALRPFRSLYPGKSYEKNKISVTYFDIPLELRYRAKNQIRASIGFKFGFLLDSHTKYRGYDYLYETSEELKVKHHEVRFIEKVRYGFTARFGWKFINLTTFYSLTGLFKDGHGDEMYPISVGISLMPF